MSWDFPQIRFAPSVLGQIQGFSHACTHALVVKRTALSEGLPNKKKSLQSNRACVFKISALSCHGVRYVVLYVVKSWTQGSTRFNQRTSGLRGWNFWELLDGTVGLSNLAVVQKYLLEYNSLDGKFVHYAVLP